MFTRSVTYTYTFVEVNYGHVCVCVFIYHQNQLNIKLNALLIEGFITQTKQQRVKGNANK